jgi:hypothetical protein
MVHLTCLICWAGEDLVCSPMDDVQECHYYTADLWPL